MSELHPIQKKLLDYLKKGTLEGKTLRGLAEELGVDHPFKISHHLEQLQKMGYLRINPADPTDYKLLRDPIKEDFAYFNVYSESAQCGPEGLLTDEHVSDRIPLSTKQFGIAKPEDYFLVKAKGNSMEPKIREGDLVLARRAETIPNGNVAIVIHDGVAKIKKFWKGDNQIVLSSLNESYSPEVVKPSEEELKLVGVVKSVVKIEEI